MDGFVSHGCPKHVEQLVEEKWRIQKWHLVGFSYPYCIFVIRFAGRLRRLQFYVALTRCLQRADYKCRHTQHVTAAHSEETILSMKVIEGLNDCAERDLLCTTQDTSFRRSVLGWKNKTLQKLSPTMNSREYQASCFGSFGFSQYLSPGVVPYTWQLKTREVYF
jgi:hypothetical protein